MWASPRTFWNSAVPPVTIPTVGLGNTGEASTEILPRLDRLKIPTHTATWSKFCVHAMCRSPIGLPAWLASVLANSRRSPGEGPGSPRSTYCCRGGLWITTRVSPRRLLGEADVVPTPIVATIAVAQATVPTVVMSFRRISPPFVVLELRWPAYGPWVGRELGKRWLGCSAAPVGGLAPGVTGLVAQAGSPAVASRRTKDFQVQILGDRRGGGPELIGEQDAAALERSQRLREVAGLAVGPHQQPIARLPEGIERQDLLHVLDGESVVALAEQDFGPAFQGPHPHTPEFLPLPGHPGALLSGQEGAPGNGGGHQGPAVRLVGTSARRGTLGQVSRVGRRLQVDPRPRREPDLVAAQRVRDRSRAVEPDLLQYRPELADDDPQRGLPSPRRLPVPQLAGQFVAMDRPLMLGGEVREHQPALSAGQAPLRDEAAVALDAHLAGQVDPKRLQRPSNDAPTAGA